MGPNSVVMMIGGRPLRRMRSHLQVQALTPAPAKFRTNPVFALIGLPDFFELPVGEDLFLFEGGGHPHTGLPRFAASSSPHRSGLFYKTPPSTGQEKDKKIPDELC